MQIESIRLKNFKAFRDVEFVDIPRLCVIVGANGSGKSTLFQVFDFLYNAYTFDDVNKALNKMGGYDEVHSRDSEGPIEIELKFRELPEGSTSTYWMTIDKRDDGTVVDTEGVLGDAPEEDFRPANTDAPSKSGRPLRFMANYLGQPAAIAMVNLIKNFRIYDTAIDIDRQKTKHEETEHLARDGENLILYLHFLQEKHPGVWEKIVHAMTYRVPGFETAQVERAPTGFWDILVKDKALSRPFTADLVSDGTIKLLAYLAVLYDPSPFPLLLVEEPENTLYPMLMEELAEEFRLYALRGGQVFLTTHSPDLLNEVNVEEVYWLRKENGYTQVVSARDDEQVAAYMAAGDQMGVLWSEGFFRGAHPE